MTISMIDYVLASGCSNTEGHEKQHVENGPVYKGTDNVWPGQLAKMLNVPFVNLARCGAGNRYIHDSIINYLNTQNNGRKPLVCAMWSHPDRFEFDQHTVIKPLHSYKYRNASSVGQTVNKFVKKIFDFDDPKAVDSNPYLKFWADPGMKMLADVWYDKLYAPYHAVRITTSYWINLQETCKARNIPFLQIQGLPLWEFPQSDQEITQFNNAMKLGVFGGHNPYKYNTTELDFVECWPNEFTKMLSRKNFIFWTNADYYALKHKPNSHVVIYEAMLNSILTKQGNYDSLQDHTRHPNLDGHKWIAQQYHDRYKELYNS